MPKLYHGRSRMIVAACLVLASPCPLLAQTLPAELGIDPVATPNEATAAVSDNDGCAPVPDQSIGSPEDSVHPPGAISSTTLPETPLDGERLRCTPLIPPPPVRPPAPNIFALY